MLNLILRRFIMSFTFRGNDVELPYYCLIWDPNNRQVVHNGGRYDFYEKPKNNKELDLCHNYSFESICRFICYCLNTKNIDYLYSLLDILYPTPEVFDNETIKEELSYYLKLDFKEEYNNEENVNSKNLRKIFPFYEVYRKDLNSALNILQKMKDNFTDMNVLYYCNALLYILNNADSNLRVGSKNWNRSLGAAYDADCWGYNKEKKFIVIVSPRDIYRIVLLRMINMDPPTFYFYVGLLPTDEPVLYSSQNNMPLPNIKSVSECNILIAIFNKQKNDYEPISNV